MDGDGLSNGNFHPGEPDPFDELDMNLDLLPVEKIENGEKETADRLLAEESRKEIREAYLKMEVMPLNKDEVRLVKDNKRVFLYGEFNAKIEAVIYKKPDDEHNIFYTKFFRDENGLRHGHEGIINDEDDPVDFQYLYELVDYRLIKNPRNPDTGKED